MSITTTASPKVRYEGARIFDEGETIRVELDQPPLVGVSSALWDNGFRKRPDGCFFRTSSPRAIFTAQDVLARFYGAPL